MVDVILSFIYHFNDKHSHLKDILLSLVNNKLKIIIG